MGHPLLREMHDEIWDRYQAGLSAAKIGLAIGKHAVSVAEYIRNDGGIRPARRCRARGQLSVEEREEISRGLAAGQSMRSIAAGLGRTPSTVSREVARNGGPEHYVVAGRMPGADRVHLTTYASSSVRTGVATTAAAPTSPLASYWDAGESSN